MGRYRLELALESGGATAAVVYELGLALRRLAGPETDVAAFVGEPDPLAPDSPAFRLTHLPKVRVWAPFPFPSLGSRSPMVAQSAKSGSSLALVAHSLGLWKETLRVEERSREPAPAIRAVTQPPSGTNLPNTGPLGDRDWAT